jgi:uncharacterized protein with GYD domain
VNIIAPVVSTRSGKYPGEIFSKGLKRFWELRQKDGLSAEEIVKKMKSGTCPVIRNFYYPYTCKGSRMTVYVMLGNLKHAAFEELDSIEERDRKAEKIIESLGGKLHSLYYTLGRYDFMAIIEMPSKETLVKFLAIVAKFGTVRTETLETIPTEMLYKIAKEA